MASQVSSISQALAGNRALLNIPQNNHDIHVQSLAAALAGKGLGGTTGLPTPPNSISPNLPPHNFRAAKFPSESVGSPPSQVDSDIDLQDAVDHANSHGTLPTSHSKLDEDNGSLEGVGIITPLYLAKFHLADIILEKGPIAIRHVMNHLAQTVPGFGDIPPAKARRIVVAALESRTGGGQKGDVEFEKVGWGRWDARVRGRSSSKVGRAMYSIQEGRRPSQAGTPTPALRIPGGGDRRQHKSRRPSYGSWNADTPMSSRLEHAGEPTHTDAAEHEADKMSIDGEEEAPVTSHRRPSVLTTSRGPVRSSKPLAPGSDTDSDDWSSLGAVALRESSYSSSAGRLGSVSLSVASARGGVRRSSSFSPHPMAIAIPSGKSWQQLQQTSRRSSKAPEVTTPKLDFSGVDVDSQEQEAIAALMQMGSL